MEENSCSYECDICGQKIKNRKILYKHFDRHQNLQCVICSRRYLDKNNLKNHLRSHFDKNYHVICDVCGKSVSSWKLKRHKEQHEPVTKNRGRSQTYECRFCGLIFDKVNNRSSHEMRIHKTKANDGLDNFKCQNCKEIFRTKDQLREHSFMHFEGKIYFCDFPGCNKYFKKGKLVTVHKRCHFDPSFKCLECGQMFVQKTGLRKHQKERCPAKKNHEIPLSLEDVEKIAEIAKGQYVALKGSLFNRTKHTQLQNSLPPSKVSKTEHEIFKVEINEKKSSSDNDDEDWQYEFLDEAFLEINETENSSLPLHNNHQHPEVTTYVVKKDARKTAQRKEKFICDLCGRRKISKISLRAHLLEHSKNKFEHRKSGETTDTRTPSSKDSNRKRTEPFVCDRCGKHFWARSSIQTHLLITHKMVADYSCAMCLRSFKTNGNLYRHIKSVHDNEKSWGCERCGKMFKEKYQLEIHLHNHDEPSECKLCGKMVSNMKVHLRHHAAKSNNTRQKCHICDKAVTKYQLARHIKTVHEKQFQRDSSSVSLKVYSCKECGDIFSRRHDLRQHEYLTHNHSKLFECKECGTFFKKLKLLNVHRFTHQPANVSCVVCKNVYARKSALWKHQKKKHPELIESRKVVS